MRRQQLEADFAPGPDSDQDNTFIASEALDYGSPLLTAGPPKLNLRD
jgi:hypothetical protein